MEKLIAGLLVVVVTLALGAGIGAAVAFAAMKLWNYAVVPTFHAPTLGFLQTWALIMLAGFVLGMIGKARK